MSIAVLYFVQFGRLYDNFPSLYLIISLCLSFFRSSDIKMDATSTTAVTVDSTILDVSATTTFEPILNLPALVTFLFITVVFTALIVRTNQVENAVQERKQTLQALRVLKSKELAGDSQVTKSQIDDVLFQYEQSVRKEESLRNILPGGILRIVPPSAGDTAEEEARVIAKQLLGQDFDIGIDKREPMNANRTLPPLAIGILTVLMVSLVSLLLFLSIDPMMGDAISIAKKTASG